MAILRKHDAWTPAVPFAVRPTMSGSRNCTVACAAVSTLLVMSG